MSDHIEEQEMEAEALSAIFDTAFTIRSSTQPFQWSIKLVPIDCGDDLDVESTANHVMVNLVATIPLDYPEVSLPELDIEILKGLSGDTKKELLQLAQEEAVANEGMPALFAVCEVVREWLADNNVKGLDDASMHAQMMRKVKEVERKEAQAAQQFEAQKTVEEMTEAEQEELAVRKRREEGTPVTQESFTLWWDNFCAEMEERRMRRLGILPMKKRKKRIMAERSTGFQIFSEKSGVFNLEKLEAEIENDVGDVDEELFDDDEDLDDLDFDSDDDDEDDDDDDSDEEPTYKVNSIL
ncbi:RWD domain-containing protein [Skeletonema marinoi]|uniref:RWD domain-containing protein n=1 Tax=Skeletonema marinoi TaxID=267567 RepID=A0AAD8YCP9_9STRA|nr:RWD domain-containing protein [Skeletonema marinoi]